MNNIKILIVGECPEALIRFLKENYDVTRTTVKDCEKMFDFPYEGVWLDQKTIKDEMGGK